MLFPNPDKTAHPHIVCSWRWPSVRLSPTVAGSAPDFSIHVMNLRTHHATTIPGSMGLWSARWSNDGRHGAALATDSRRLMAFEFRHWRWEPVAKPAFISDLNWTYYDNWMYFQAHQTARTFILSEGTFPINSRTSYRNVISNWFHHLDPIATKGRVTFQPSRRRSL